MKNTLIILLVILPGFIFGQAVKKVKVKNKNPHYREEYYVLKSDRSVKHGSYKKFSFRKVLLTDGYYKDGKKDSIWTEYAFAGSEIAGRGRYSNEERAGIWRFYGYGGKLEQKYDYTNKKLLYPDGSESVSLKTYKIVKGRDTVDTKLDLDPIYIGGDATLLNFLAYSIRYPRKAMENGTMGIVYITFVVDKNGKAIAHKVLRGIGSGCDAEALRVAKKIPDSWRPGVLDGQKVDVIFNLPVRYVLR